MRVLLAVAALLLVSCSTWRMNFDPGKPLFYRIKWDCEEEMADGIPNIRRNGETCEEANRRSLKKYYPELVTDDVEDEYTAPVVRQRKPRLPKPRTAKEQRIDHYSQQALSVCQINLNRTIGRVDPTYDSFDDCWNGTSWYFFQAKRLVELEDEDLETGCIRSDDDIVTYLCEILSTDGHRKIVEECKSRAAIGELTDATRAVLCVENTHIELLKRNRESK